MSSKSARSLYCSAWSTRVRANCTQSLRFALLAGRYFCMDLASAVSLANWAACLALNSAAAFAMRFTFAWASALYGCGRDRDSAVFLMARFQVASLDRPTLAKQIGVSGHVARLTDRALNHNRRTSRPPHHGPPIERTREGEHYPLS